MGRHPVHQIDETSDNGSIGPKKSALVDNFFRANIAFVTVIGSNFVPIIINVCNETILLTLFDGLRGLFCITRCRGDL